MPVCMFRWSFAQRKGLIVEYCKNHWQVEIGRSRGKPYRWNEVALLSGKLRADWLQSYTLYGRFTNLSYFSFSGDGSQATVFFLYEQNIDCFGMRSVVK